MIEHAHTLPSQMNARKQWVLWRKERRNGKDTKVPYQPTGARASTTQPDTWSSLQDCQAVLLTKPGRFDGLGFVFSNDDPFVGIDIDHVQPDNPLVGAIVKRFDSYAEISQSGQGVHIIIKARKPRRESKFTFRGLDFEIYSQGRYFVMTGNVLAPYTTIKPRQDALDALYARAFHAEPPAKPEKPPVHMPTAENLHEVVLSVMQEHGAGLLENYQDWLRFCYACKAAGIPYHRLDGIFQQSPRYNQQENQAIYDKLKPASITFRTAYHYAIQANELEVKRRLKPQQAEKPHDPVTLKQLQAEEKADLLNRYKRQKDVAFDLSQQHWFLHDYFQAVKDSTDARPQTLITPLLSALAANIGNKVFIRSGFRKHYCNIWSIIIGPSTIGRKTTSLNLACSPLKDYNAELKRKYEQDMEVYEMFSDEEKKEMKEPQRKFIIYPSCPAEQFLLIVGQNPVGLLQYSEIADFLIKMNKSYNADFKSMITAMFDGVGAERATRSHGIEGVETPAFSIATATTKEWFLKELDAENDVNSGFLQRFLVCNSYDINFDDLKFEFREGTDTQQYVKNRLARTFARLREIGTEHDPVEITLTQDVKRLYAERYKAILKPYFDEDDTRMYSYVGRLFEDYFFRFMILFVLLDKVESDAFDDTDQLVADIEHAKAAHALCAYYLKNIEVFLRDDVSATQEERNEQMIVRILRRRKERQGLNVVSHAMLKRWSHLKKQDFEEAIASLAEGGVIDILHRKAQNNKNAIFYQLILSDEVDNAENAKAA